MTQLACPFCGPRELDEFLFRKTLPEPGASPFADVYQRTNRAEISAEHWQHVRGCRAWLAVTRNPTSGQVLEVKCLGDAQ